MALEYRAEVVEWPRYRAMCSAMPGIVKAGPADFHHIKHPAITGYAQQADDLFGYPLDKELHKLFHDHPHIFNEQYDQVGLLLKHLQRMVRCGVITVNVPRGY